MLDSLTNILLVVFAFGFVIFWHELGHFLAARWAGVRVEQFAVGMGQAVVSWRKGLGFRTIGFGKKGFHWGSSQESFEKLIKAEFSKRRERGDTPDRPFSSLSVREQYDIARDIGLGETEYRLSWLPLGGYVKPTGQDDLRPAAEVGKDDPHAFGAKPVGKRMVIISAGVVMNIILAFALYVLLFMVGFNAPAPVVGSVSPGSPAERAGIRVGDRIVSIGGDKLQDFTKIQMSIALLRDDHPASIVVRRADTNQEETLQVQPIKTKQSFNMPAIGVGAPYRLKAADAKHRSTLLTSVDQAIPPDSVITSINGDAVSENDFYKLESAINNYNGTPVVLGITALDGKASEYSLTPELGLFDPFTSTDLSLAGMRPRVAIEGVMKGSPAETQGVKPGDVVEKVAIVETADALQPPSVKQFQEWVNDAGTASRKIRLTVSRDGQTIAPLDITPQGKWPWSTRTIGVLLSVETDKPVVGEILSDSSAAKAGLKPDDQIISIAGKPVTSWFDLVNIMRSTTPGELKIVAANDAGERTITLLLTPDDTHQASLIRYGHNLPLEQLIERRKTTNPITAAKWGVTETKFSVIQVYQTLQRLVQRTVPVSNLSGPLGIFSAGASAADRGMDWLIWFTAMISANLAVVNFLPIPIVDGGLFLFLLAEKFTGKPPSPRLQAAAQVFGLVLLGSLFLFVTYHDVLRIFG